MPVPAQSVAFFEVKASNRTNFVRDTSIEVTQTIEDDDYEVYFDSHASKYSDQAIFVVKNKQTGEKNKVGFDLRYYNSQHQYG